MTDEGDVSGATDIQVAPSGGEPSSRSPGSVGRGSSGPRRVVDGPAGALRRGMGWYRGLDQRDRLVVLMGFLVFVLAIIIIAIYLTGGGVGGGGGGGPVMVHISDWDRSSLESVLLDGDEANTNLEGQQTPYLVPMQPNGTEVLFITRLTAHVTWSDETVPPTNLPARGYTNQPDGFMLRIIVREGIGLWESPLEFNTIGQSHEITLEVDLVEELGGPVAVANPQGAKYLPEGYVQAARVDFVVFTEDCGEWTTSDPRPDIGDGGNSYTFEWSVEYQIGSTTKGP